MVFAEFEPAHSHRATRAILNKRFGKGWVSCGELVRKLHVSRKTLTALLQRGLIDGGTRVGAYRVWSLWEHEAVSKRINKLRDRAQTAYPRKRPDGRWECPDCKKTTKTSCNGAPAPLIRHVRSCPDLWVQLDRAEEFGETWRLSRKTALREAGLQAVEVREGNVVRGKLVPANFTQVLGSMPNATLKIGDNMAGEMVGFETIVKADKTDLVYALSQLVEMRKVTVPEVGALMAARTARIKALETELGQLKTQGVGRGQFWQIALNKVIETATAKTAPESSQAFAFSNAEWHRVEPKDVPERRQTARRHLAGKFYALVQHRCKAPRAKAYWHALAKKIGIEAATAKFEKTHPV
jgi:hypothetical protein